jgi:2-iminobutanoate/2-iminopropanoate deaminase
MKQVVTSPNAPKPVGPYSQAIQAGNTLYISGQIAFDPKTNMLLPADIGVQARQVMENIKAILSAADYTLKDVVQTTVYLSSMKLFGEFNTEYARFFQADYPARATVACELKAGALVEVSAVAYRRNRRASIDKL